jgi:hypothetical protein
MFNGVSTNGTSNVQMQIGSGSVTTTGYTSQNWAGSASGVITSGFLLTQSFTAASTWSGTAQLTLIGSNTWVATGIVVYTNATSVGEQMAGNSPALSGALDRVVITTVNGTDTFDAGVINIQYE